MPDSKLCLSSRAALQEIRSLKQSFNSAFDRAITSNKPSDITKAQTLKQDLITKTKALRETLYPLEAERLFDLKQQYNTQVDLLKRTGLLQSRKEKDPSSDKEQEILFITGINNTEYPIPSYQTLISRLAEKKELFRQKADQGFKKFFLIPFGMSLDLMIESLRKFLLEYKKAYDKKQKDGREFPLDIDEPVWVWKEEYNDADKKETLIYDPTSFDKDNHGGKTKTQILTDQEAINDPTSGWRFLFCQEGKNGKGIRSIPRAGKGKPEGTEMRREDIQAGKTAQEYLADQQAASPNPDSPYHAESGLTPEEWMMLFMRHLEETGQRLDNWHNDEDSVAYLIGAFFPASADVPVASWSLLDRRVGLSISVPAGPSVYVGVRSVVRG